MLIALDQLENAQQRLKKAEEADNAKLLLRPEISFDFRAAKKDAKAVAKKANELAGPERAVTSILGVVGQIAGIGGPVGLLGAGLAVGFGRMRQRNKLHQLARAQGVDPHSPTFKGVDQFEMMYRLAQSKANGASNGSGQQVAVPKYAAANASGEHSLQ